MTDIDAPINSTPVSARQAGDETPSLEIPEVIRERTERFTGRVWALKDVFDWMKEGRKPFWLVTGDPGSGNVTDAKIDD